MDVKEDLVKEDLATEFERTALSLLSELQSRFSDLYESQDPAGNIDQIISLLDKFQESPQLLDQKIELLLAPLPQRLLESSTSPEYARLLYCFTKVRGYKVVSKFFTNDVYLIASIYGRWISAETWEGRYIYGLWLSMLILVPFELTSISPTLAQDIYTNALGKLRQPGKESFSASLILSRMLGRSDMRDELLPQFLAVCTNSQLQTSDAFFTAGILQTLANTLKTAPPHSVVPYSNTIFGLMADIVDNYADTRITRLAIKVEARLSLLLLGSTKNVIPDVVEMCISTALYQLENRDTVTRCTSAKQIANICASLPALLCDEVINEIFRLFLADTSVDKTNDLYDISFVSVDKWHGLTFCLAELLRKGLVKKEMLSGNLDRILKTALTFEQLSVNHSLGGAVQDAGAYACWSLARSYHSPPVDLVMGILRTLVCVACFDREINMRRAAAAAVQECIGRQSRNIEQRITIANGLKLVETLDFYKVSNRDRAYLEMAYAVGLIKQSTAEDTSAQFVLLDSLINHLMHFSVRSFDVTVRRLAGKSLGKLIKNCSNITQKRMIGQLLDEIFTSLSTSQFDVFHGTSCALTQVLLSSEVPKGSNFEQRLNELLSLICKMSNESRFAEHLTWLVSEATSELVTASVKVGLLSTNNLLNQTFDVIMKGVEEGNVLSLIRSLIRLLGLSDGGSIDKKDRYLIFPETLDYWKSRVKRGNADFTVLLGETCVGFDNKSSRIAWSEGIVKFLSLQFREAMNIEQKVAIVNTLNDITIQWTEYTAEDPFCPFDEWVCSQISEVVKASLDDYSTDPRGDVGSWLRAAGMTCAETLFASFDAKFTSESFSVDWNLIWREMMLRCLRIAGEKLDRLRVQAFRVGTSTINDSESSQLTGDETNNRPIFEGLCRLIESDTQDEQQVRYILAGLVLAVAGGGTSDVFSSCLSLPVPRPYRLSKNKLPVKDGQVMMITQPTYIVAAKSVYTTAHKCFCEEFLPRCSDEAFSACCKSLCLLLSGIPLEIRGKEAGGLNNRVVIPALKVWTSMLDLPEIYSRLRQREDLMSQLYETVNDLRSSGGTPSARNGQLQISCLGVFAGLACLDVAVSNKANLALVECASKALLKPVRKAAEELRFLVKLQVPPI